MLLTMDIWRHVAQSDGCWLWTGSRRRDGYGVLQIVRGKQVRAHRVIYEMSVGPIPPGLHLMHLCDNPPCVRPDHLRPGTQADNLADMTAKGRRSHKTGRPQRGSLNHGARFTEEQVAEIKRRLRAGERHHVIASDYGVHRATISQIARGFSWSHVP